MVQQSKRLQTMEEVWNKTLVGNGTPPPPDKPNLGSYDSDGMGKTPSDAVVGIVNRLLHAEGMQLLQLTPISPNNVFDLAYDVMQRGILDQERIEKRIPLSAVFFEAYLRARRGADRKLTLGMLDLAHDQLQAQQESKMDEYSR